MKISYLPLTIRWGLITDDFSQLFGHNDFKNQKTPKFNLLSVNLMKILIVDDEPVTLALTSGLISAAGYNPIQATSAEQAFNILKSVSSPMVVLLDWMMPGMDGLALCKLIRETDLGYSPYIVMVTGKDDQEAQIQALTLGADDFLSKPVESYLLLARIKVAERIIGYQQALMRANDILTNLAYIDELTQIPNRRSGLESIKTERLRMQRSGYSSACLILSDIDYFKRVNDTYGHNVGDKVLIEFTKRVSASLRPFDIFCRYGGEEFIIFCEVSIVDVEPLLERLSNQIRSLPFIVDDHSLTLTASFGAVYFNHDNSLELKNLIKLSDEALYNAKANGRDRYEIYRLANSGEERPQLGRSHTKQ